MLPVGGAVEMQQGSEAELVWESALWCPGCPRFRDTGFNDGGLEPVLKQRLDLPFVSFESCELV